jgi:hypothetical protein
MTYSRAAWISLLYCIGFALYSILFQHLWEPTATRLGSWFEHSYFFVFGVFIATWSWKRDTR